MGKGKGNVATFRHRRSGRVVSVTQDDPRYAELVRMRHRWAREDQAEPPKPAAVKPGA